MNRISIESFYTTWKAQLDVYLKDYIFDTNRHLLKTRFAYSLLSEYLKKLFANKLADHERIVLLPGLRGVGKTTLLAQLYFYEKYLSSNLLVEFVQKSQDVYKFYVSVDRLYALGIKLIDFYEFLKTFVFPKYANSKILLLIDEIQYDQDWALFLKLVFDENIRNQNLLLVATGSSALLLNTQNQDLVRRAMVHHILPETFAEYLTLHKKINIDNNLSNRLQEVLFWSNNIQQAYSQLNELKAKIVNQLGKIPSLSLAFDQYLNKGAFPFSAVLNDAQAMQKIREMILVNIVQKDILQFGHIEAGNFGKISDLLFLLANSDKITTGNIARTLNISLNTVNKLIDLLKKAELLIEIKPYASPYAQVRKSSKLLFVSPNIRWALLQGLVEKHKGKMLEDYIAFVLYKELTDKVMFLHDFSKKGADFVLRYPDNSEIVLEVGFSKDTQKQVENTMRRTQNRAKYGIVIGAHKLEITNNILWIPLEYVLLM